MVFTWLSWLLLCLKVLDKVINCFKFPEIISNPQVTHPFIIQSDASQKGLEAVFYQKVNGKIKIISFPSVTLLPFKKILFQIFIAAKMSLFLELI